MLSRPFITYTYIIAYILTKLSNIKLTYLGLNMNIKILVREKEDRWKLCAIEGDRELPSSHK